MVAIAGEEVGKGAEFLILVLTQGVEFGLDSSSGGVTPRRVNYPYRRLTKV